jgi:hypothetical protein
VAIDDRDYTRERYRQRQKVDPGKLRWGFGKAARDANAPKTKSTPLGSASLNRRKISRRLHAAMVQRWQPRPPLGGRTEPVMEQCDLFGEPPPQSQAEEVTKVPLSPLAAPCAFRNRSNKSCQRLARDPIRLDGRTLHYHGRLLLHCPLVCFNGASAEETRVYAEAAE